MQIANQEQYYYGSMPNSAGVITPQYSTIASAGYNPHISGNAQYLDGVQQEQLKAQKYADEHQADTITDLGVMAGEALPMMAKINPYTAAISTGFGALGASRESDRNIEQLVDSYRDIVAMQLGITPEAVGEKELRTAAENNKIIREAIDAIDGTEASETAGLATGAAATVALASGGTMLPAMIIPFLAERGVAGLNGTKDIEETAHGHLIKMKQKMAGGEYLSAADIFDIYVALDERLAQQIEQSEGEKWENLTDEQKAKSLVERHPRMLEICKFEAALINSGAMKPEMALFASPDEIMSIMQRQQQANLISNAQMLGVQLPNMYVQQAVPAAISTAFAQDMTTAGISHINTSTPPSNRIEAATAQVEHMQQQESRAQAQNSRA